MSSLVMWKVSSVPDILAVVCASVSRRFMINADAIVTYICI